MPFPLTVASILVVIHTPSSSETTQISTAPPLSSGIEIFRSVDPLSVNHHQGTIVCRNVTPLGTKVERRICHTKAEWEKMAAANKRVMERFNRRF